MWTVIKLVQGAVVKNLKSCMTAHYLSQETGDNVNKQTISNNHGVS